MQIAFEKKENQQTEMKTKTTNPKKNQRILILIKETSKHYFT